MSIAVLLTCAALGFTEPLVIPDPEGQAPPPPQVESKTPPAPKPPMAQPMAPAPSLPQVPPPPMPQTPPPDKKSDKKTEATLPPPRLESKEVAKTPEAAATVEKEAPLPLTPAYPAFADPRTYTWTQHRLPPPDLPCTDMACQLGLCLKDHRCLREKVLDYLVHWCCPSRLVFGKCCPENP